MNWWLIVIGAVMGLPLAVVMLVLYCKWTASAMKLVFHKEQISFWEEDEAHLWWYIHVVGGAGLGWFLFCIGIGWW